MNRLNNYTTLILIFRETDHPKFVMWHKKWQESLDNVVDTETKSVVKLDQNSSEGQLAPIPDLISSFSQSETHPGSQVGYEAEHKSPPAPFTNQAVSCTPPVVRSKPEPQMLENVEPNKTSLVEASSPLVGTEELSKEEAKDTKKPDIKSLEELSKASVNDQVSLSEAVKQETCDTNLKPSQEPFKPLKTQPEHEEKLLSTETANEKPKLAVKMEVSEGSPKDESSDSDKMTSSSNKEPKMGTDNKDTVTNTLQSTVPEDDQSIKTQTEEKKLETKERESGKKSVPESNKNEKTDLVKNELDGPQTEELKIEKAEDTLKTVADGGSQDSLEDPEDLALALGDIGAGVETSINDGLVDLLSSHPELEQLVDGSELPHLVPTPVTVPSGTFAFLLTNHYYCHVHAESFAICLCTFVNHSSSLHLHFHLHSRIDSFSR